VILCISFVASRLVVERLGEEEDVGDDLAGLRDGDGDDDEGGDSAPLDFSFDLLISGTIVATGAVADPPRRPIACIFFVSVRDSSNFVSAGAPCNATSSAL